jgi:hypothetical protein
VGLLITLAIALGVMLVVALPNLRSGSRILTPDGERVVERAKEQAKQKPVAVGRAAGSSTWHGLVVLRRRSSRAWAPISATLHEAMDRLEGRDRDSDADPSPESAASGPSNRPSNRPSNPSTEPVAGRSTVGRPRSSPAVSGPIPEITDAAAGREARTASPDSDSQQVIDLRETQDDIDQQAGIARHAR